jgi:hypothetical protein
MFVFIAHSETANRAGQLDAFSAKVGPATIATVALRSQSRPLGGGGNLDSARYIYLLVQRLGWGSLVLRGSLVLKNNTERCWFSQTVAKANQGPV